MLSHQDSVPEYDEIMGRDNMRALEVLEGGGNGDSEGEEGSWVEDGDAQSFGHGSFGGGEPTIVGEHNYYKNFSRNFQAL